MNRNVESGCVLGITGVQGEVLIVHSTYLGLRGMKRYDPGSIKKLFA
jgi:hypothetical protein